MNKTQAIATATNMMPKGKGYNYSVVVDRKNNEIHIQWGEWGGKA
jgi:hypothetical protein